MDLLISCATFTVFTTVQFNWILPAGMVARQLLSTFMANSATAAGVKTSSHAGEERRRLQPTSQKTKQEEISLLCKRVASYVQCCWPWCPWRSVRLTSWIPPLQESAPEVQSWPADQQEMEPEGTQERWDIINTRQKMTYEMKGKHKGTKTCVTQRQQFVFF